MSRKRPQSINREGLALLGSSLAQAHKGEVSIQLRSRLYRDLSEICYALESNYLELKVASKKRESLTPGVEWFLDNYHIVEKHIIDIRRHFPKAYDRTLLKVTTGPDAGYPRVYVMARELLSNTDAVLDVSLLDAFLRGYQEHFTLNIGEVWAVPIMLRFALLRHLVELTTNMIGAMKDKALVEKLIDEIIGDEERPSTEILLILAKKVVERPDFLISGAPNLIRRLRDRGPRASLTLQWVEERIREQKREPEELLREEQYWLAADQISIANTFASLRGHGFINWQEWVEGASVLEKTLRRDFQGIYQKSDFLTRDRTRRAVEKLSRQGRVSELKVAETALSLAKDDSVLSFLVGHRVNELRSSLDSPKSIVWGIKSIVKTYPFHIYSFAIILITCLLILRISFWTSSHGIPVWQLAILGVIALILALDLATNLVQWAISKFTPPSLLPKLDLEDGIPDESKTAVVVQCVISDPDSLDRSLEGLHVRALGNDDPNLIFGLLADFSDSKSEEFDHSILTLASQRVEALNSEGLKTRFFVYFRKRLWNESEQKWMGWERKRGKLEEFNRLILGDDSTTFISPENLDFLRQCKYVITLDNDSQLPPLSAKKLVGAISHPLNRPVVENGIVKKGYAIIQPRMGISLTSAFASRFAQIFSGHSGLDPYTQSVSDIYQDFFGEASYIGKGIYDIRAFEESLRDRVPENSLLSHDLFESLFARCALASDIELYDDFPSKYFVHSKRQHRWIRGDWQIIPWIPPYVPNKNWNYYKTVISPLGRWKLFDNLRRSLVAPALMALMLLGWGVFPGDAIKWLGIALLVVAFPVAANLAQAFIIPARNIAIGSHVRGIGRDLFKILRQTFFTFVFLPHQALNSLSAISITLYRRFISKKNLLEWETAASAEKRISVSLVGAVREMSTSLSLTALFVVAGSMLEPESTYVSVPVLALWLTSPFFAYYLSKPPTRESKELDPAEREYLNRIAFDTWKYFKTHLTEKYNYLIPDNLQIIPEPVVAERTSPTNISLSLLSVTSAYDLGFIPLSKAMQLLDKITDSLSSLEKYQGHFINWYGTDDRRTLSPRYVSFVDSGNLIGHFLVLKNTVADYRSAPLLTEKHRQHLINTTGKEISPDISFKELFDLVQDEDLLSSKDWVIDLSEKAFGTRGKDSELFERLESWFNNAVISTNLQMLYDAEKGLFVIGYNVDSARKDQSYYDLLASEARLGSFLAVALGQVPQKHWFALGRSLTESAGGKALLSWSGTMFEYLMPLLVMKDFPETLLSETYRSVVDAQKAYGRKVGVPWGISESAYSGVDFEKTFQYRAFGVPGLGMKRGLDDDLIISPYSTLLATMVAPREAIRNLKELEREGLRGEYGFYESVDYTASRLGVEEKNFIVKAFFAHHQGMSLVALNNVLNNGIVQERFHRDPLVKSCELLLHEKFPERLPTITAEEATYQGLEGAGEEQEESVVQIVKTPHTVIPKTHILSNGYLTSVIDNAGSGYLLFEKELMLTRWREDPIVNRHGIYIYIRDLDSGECWSAGFQPTARTSTSYEVVFAPDKAEIKRRDFDIFSYLEITVSPEENVEIRKLTLANIGTRRRRLEITSYGEVCLSTHKADLAHPAFQKMFIKSEHLEDLETLLFMRRPRSVHEHPLMLFHQVAMKRVWARTTFESSKVDFIGRNRTAHNPIGLSESLKENAGVVLDPIFSLRVRVDLEEGESESVNFITGVAGTKEEVVRVAQKYRDVYQIHRAFEMSWSQSSVELRNERISARQAQSYQKLANCLIFNSEKARISSDVLQKNRLTQSGLWRYGISGDLPMCVVRISEHPHLDLVEEALKAHYYLRSKGFQFDLIIVNEFPAGYMQNLQEEVEHLVRSSLSAGLLDKKGGVFLRTVHQISSQEQILLFSVARVVLNGAQGSLLAQLKMDETAKAWVPVPEAEIRLEKITLPNQGDFKTSYGRFFDNNYVIEGQPPLPWSNVVANPEFGFLVTETGGGYTWSENSRENRLTAWSNDPVSDPPSEIIYARDSETGEYWNLFGGTVAHGLGYSQFTGKASSINSDLTVTISKDKRVKWWGISLTNESNKPRELEVFLYVDWVLGIIREEANRFLNTGFDEVAQALWAVNYYNNEFAGRYVYISSSEKIVSYTSSKTDFVGRNRDLKAPAVLEEGASRSSVTLSKRIGAGFDVGGVIAVHLKIPPKETKTFSFFMGEVMEHGMVRDVVSKLSAPGTFETEFEATKQYFRERCSPVAVSTPDKGFDILMNSWLLYQTLSCRILGRSAFYQSGGAFGFRDQLQDSLAFLPFNPEMVKEQIKLHASRQFIEGDVQHWWHPPTGRGTRTRFSDDFLWMPYAVLRYIEVTGDYSILEERVSFIGGQTLQPHEHEVYIVPTGIVGEGTIYEHCVKALYHGMTKGVHDLPLMGCGDWNDGMNEVGREGKGESVWLGWFMQPILRGFATIATRRDDRDNATKFNSYAEDLNRAVEAHAWDGNWYRRAFFDDGTPLGSAANDECKIDSLAQSWAVIVGTGDQARAKRAMESAREHLVDREHRIIRLLTPAFDNTSHNPGYIKGYLPGIRENGAQYTHAATWLVIAEAQLGNGTSAFDLWSMLNPITHTESDKGVEKYQGEPYVLCGDVYSVSPHEGRAGWSWYTGSSGWLFQAGLHYILGIKFHPDGISLSPSVPTNWKEFSAQIKLKGVLHKFRFKNPSGVYSGVSKIEMKGQIIEGRVPYQSEDCEIDVTLS